MNEKYIKYFHTIALETAMLSTATKLKVGCIIVKGTRILSIGYNGTPAGWDNECEVNGKTKPEVLHAEANALMKLAQSTESSKDAVLFITHFPCIECAKLIYQAGISKVYYGQFYEASKGCGESFLKKAGIELYAKT
tara:strand:- start:11432 stop:11842 length:411 start_codon:yes stop_codon:yes gene_type:complete